VTELCWEADIRASAQRIFSRLADLRDYDQWLPRSPAFRGTTEISDGPIGVGTTYVERGPMGTRDGKVTEYAPPTRLNFEQPMTLNPSWLGVIGIKLFHTLTPGVDSVHVVRALQLSPRGPIRFAMPLVVRSFKSENERMMKFLKESTEREFDGV
jgi:uncharacterized protein YndB with AHSA1/START domain